MYNMLLLLVSVLLAQTVAGSLVRFTSTKTGNVNGWDGSFDWTPGGNKVITGMSSTHNNHKEDRIWQFYTSTYSPCLAEAAVTPDGAAGKWSYELGCRFARELTDASQCEAKCTAETNTEAGCCECSGRCHRCSCAYCTVFCKKYIDDPQLTCTAGSWTSYRNDWDGVLNYQCSGANQVLAGISSYHDDGREDRRWRFKCCDISSGGAFTITKKYTTDYINNWDAAMDSRCLTHYAMVGVYSYHDNGREDRRWKLICGKVQSV